MRILDEQQLFEIGDQVLLEDGRPGIVDSVISSSVYYEARPIASFTEFTYVVVVDGKREYLKAKQLSK